MKRIKEVYNKFIELIEIINFRRIFRTFFSWLFVFLFLEFIFMFFMYDTYQKDSIINIFYYSVINASVFSIIGQIFKGKINRIITSITLGILGLMFSIQCVFYKVFKVYFSLFNLGLSDQLKSFWKDAIKLIFSNIFYILIFFLPLIIYNLFYKKFKLPKNNIKNYVTYFIILIIALISFEIHIGNTKNKINGAYDLYNNVNEVSLNVNKLGVVNAYHLDLYRMLFGFTANIKNVNLENNTNDKKEETKKEEKKVYKDNVLELNLDKETNNNNIKKINEYIKSDTPTKQNEYTGMFKDYNLIYITAESFSEIGVSKELTPTLYKLVNDGFVFDNFYTPNNLSTIGGEFQTMTGLFPDASILTKWRNGTNYYPYGLATIFKKYNYNTYAYHNNSYVFQDRNKYMASQGFDNYLGCYNGLEKRMNCKRWPQSDLEMMEITIPDYIESDKPFLAYYMTVSGHFDYTFDDNSMASKNRDYVKDLDVGSRAKAYVATQIELDKALEKLIEELDNKGILDKTVIVLAADHYPYELDINSINSLSEFNRDEEIGINHNALIIWNNKLPNKHITKPCMSTDIIPTVFNLFGIEYDSRLFTGRDILSDSFGIAIMRNRSWVTDKGMYYANSNNFVPNENNEVDEEYIRNVNTLINNRLTISKLIVENDYYKYLFDE